MNNEIEIKIVDFRIIIINFYYKLLQIKLCVK